MSEARGALIAVDDVTAMRAEPPRCQHVRYQQTEAHFDNIKRSRSLQVSSIGVTLTLVLSEISPLGIVMAADSAFTTSDGCVRLGDKIFAIPELGAGLSYWGKGLPGHPDEWIRRFISDHSACNSLDEFAGTLRDTLRGVEPPLRPDGQKNGTIGFHLAGFVSHNEPTLYHIHNGISTTLAARGIQVDPDLVNANNEIPPSVGRVWICGMSQQYTLRNGDYKPYATIWDQAGVWPERLRLLILQESGGLPDLDERALFVASQIEMMRVLYVGIRQQRLTGAKYPSIGGSVKYLSIRDGKGVSNVQAADFSADIRPDESTYPVTSSDTASGSIRR